MTSDLSRLHSAIRSLSVLISFSIVADFLSPALWILNEPTSVISRVASLSTSEVFISACWFTASALVLPFVLMQLFYPDCVHRRKIIKAATYGMIIGAVVWVFMAFLSRNLDYEFAVWNFMFNGMMALSMAALMANGLNNDQIEVERDSQRAEL